MAKVTLILEDGVRPDGTEIVSMEVKTDSPTDSVDDTTMAEHLGAEAFAFIATLMKDSPSQLVEPMKIARSNNEEMN